MSFEFKYRLGDRVFFQGKDARHLGCTKISSERIYEGKVVESSLVLEDVTPNEILPLQRVSEDYTLSVGKHKDRIIVPANCLTRSPEELFPLTITRLYDPLQ